MLLPPPRRVNTVNLPAQQSAHQSVLHAPGTVNTVPSPNTTVGTSPEYSSPPPKNSEHSTPSPSTTQLFFSGAQISQHFIVQGSVHHAQLREKTERNFIGFPVQGAEHFIESSPGLSEHFIGLLRNVYLLVVLVLHDC